MHAGFLFHFGAFHCKEFPEYVLRIMLSNTIGRKKGDSLENTPVGVICAIHKSDRLRSRLYVCTQMRSQVIFVGYSDLFMTVSGDHLGCSGDESYLAGFMHRKTHGGSHTPPSHHIDTDVRER